MKVIEFVKEIKLEAKKIVWPSRKETTLTCVIVVVSTLIAGLFFLVTDSIIYKLTQYVLGI